MSMTPREIVQELDKHIIGQDAAKRAVLRHQERKRKSQMTVRQWCEAEAQKKSKRKS